MSQAVNKENSPEKKKRPYRKGNPLTLAERQQAALARKRVTHKEVRIFVRNDLKARLQEICEERGLTQAEMIEYWISNEAL